MNLSAGNWILCSICSVVATTPAAGQSLRPSHVEEAQSAAGANKGTPRSAGLALHIATYNIEHGYRVPGAAKRISAFLGGLVPDIVCLQESHWRGPASGLARGHPDAIAKTLGEYVWCAGDRGPPARGMHSGMAIVTRGRIVSHESLKIEHESPYGVLAEIEIDGVRLIVVSVHLRSLNGATIRGAVSTETARVRQVDHLMRRLDRETIPVLVAGDFNALPFFPSYGVTARKLPRRCA